ncbi:MAG: SMC-Scp complex subunit ScpB [Myxococcales bacterium]|nr:SMC-Scp complex subunit ScpB [Myxococcales bacterium]
MSHRPTKSTSEDEPRLPLDASLANVGEHAGAADEAAADRESRQRVGGRRLDVADETDVAEHEVPAAYPADSENLSQDLSDDEASDDEALAELLRNSSSFATEPADREGEAEPSSQTLPPPRLRSVLESLLFVADKPLTLQRLLEILEEQAHEPSGRQGPPLYQPSQVQDALVSLAESYLREERGVELHQVAGGWQLRTAPSNAPWVQRQLQQKPQRLSRAQLETMTIVAYRQPITRPEIDDVRGVDSGGALKTLLERRLVRILGKKEEPGRPLLYGTTREFLEFFNLRDLKDLPTLREYYELNDENKARVRAAHPDAALPLSLDSEARASQHADGPQQISLPEAPGQPTVAPLPPLPGLLDERPPATPPSPPPLSRVEILDQQLADDAEHLAKIDELIASVKGETPPIDVLLGMAEAAAMADSQTHSDESETAADGLSSQAEAHTSAFDDEAEPASPDDDPTASPQSEPSQAAEPAAADPAAPTVRRGRKKA